MRCCEFPELGLDLYLSIHGYSNIVFTYFFYSLMSGIGIVICESWRGLLWSFTLALWFGKGAILSEVHFVE
jgi:hypothetical protein